MQGEDCDECKFCADKPKYGGPGKLKQGCKRRKCEQVNKNWINMVAFFYTYTSLLI